MDLNTCLSVCELSHGGPANSADVYGHFGSKRVCIFILGPNVWVYAPATEQATLDDRLSANIEVIF